MIIDVHTHPPEFKAAVPEDQVIWNHKWRPDRPVRATTSWQDYLDAQGPADKSIVTSAGNYFGMCTNYQITGEVFTRAVVKLEGTARNPRPVVLSYNVLPAD